jgi:threonine aldolase
VFIKRKIRKRVIALYLNGACLWYISVEIDISVEEVEHIIDYWNELYN